MAAVKTKLGGERGGGIEEMGRRLPEFITKNYTVTAAAAFTAVSLLLIATSHLPLRRLSLPAAKFPDQQQSCRSRNQRSSYHKHQSAEPPPYLLFKLRQYERRHRRCASFNPSSSSSTLETTHRDCKFVVYAPSQGLGNRILGLTSTFLYALLTDRILLVDFTSDMADLFCEPFPNSTWLLPENFPHKEDLYSDWFRDAYSYGKFLEKKENNSDSSPENSNSNSTLMQIFLDDDYNDYDKLFFQDENQYLLEEIPWLVLISDGYFLPCLFQMGSFSSELEKLFPDRSAVFHQLGNYLLSPSDQAWSIITKFYDAHLAEAEQRIGIQIRVFDSESTPPEIVMKQILSCPEKQRLLPHPRSAVLVASLSSEFYGAIKAEFGGGGGGGIEVYQASHEEAQQSSSGEHNMKAWADIYLLSMSDVLVTSGMSTFGYVAAGIGGVRPWIVTVPDLKYHPEVKEWAEVCEMAVNVEPCFHFPPWFAYPDRRRGKESGGGGGGGVERCEDVPWGLKLVNRVNRTELS